MYVMATPGAAPTSGARKETRKVRCEMSVMWSLHVACGNYRIRRVASYVQSQRRRRTKRACAKRRREKEL